jgi:hypothetical protein
MKNFLLALLTLALVTAPVPVAAQSSTGGIVGTVSSPDGVLAGATVRVVDDQTKRERVVTSSGDGTFVVPQLEVGTYTVNVTASGFKGFTVTGVKVDAGRDYPLAATLEVGGVTETVTVVAGAETINASDAELSNTVSPHQIRELPLDGRNPLTLIPLQAGTAKATGGSVTYINGQRTAFTNITRDGINVNDNFIRANATDFSPERASSDDTGEFTVTTQNAGAERGYGAAQVELVTPRGQSEFHGAVFAYNRNSYFAANTFPNNSAGRDANGDPRIPRPYLNRNQFGGKIGGPLPLPNFGEGGDAVTRNKGFFFFSYEKQFLRQSQTNVGNVLTANARNGLFTFADSAGVTRSVNLFSIAPAGSPTGINPVIQSRLIAPLPLPNTPGGDANVGLNSYNSGFNSDYNYYTTRIDLDLNDRNTINGVYTYKKEVVQRPDVNTDAAAAQSFTAGGSNYYSTNPPATQPGINKFMALAWNFTPTGNFTNEVRGGFSWPEAIFDSTSALPAFFLDSPIINEPEPRFLDQGRTQRNYNIQDNATWTKGNHSIRFGVLGQFFHVNPYNDAGTVPTFILGFNPANVNTSGFSNNAPQLTAANFASVLGGNTISATNLQAANNLFHLLGGIIDSGTQTFNPTDPTSSFAPTSLRQFYEYNNYAGYISDQWRLRPELTVNLGLRYDVITALRLKNRIALEPIIPEGTDPRAALLDPNGGYQIVGGNAGCEGCFFKTDKNNFAPIVSVAWAPQFKNGFLRALGGDAGQTVIRGGFRVSYVADQFLTATRNALNGNVGLGSTALPATVNGSTQLNARPDSVPTINAPAPISFPRTFAFNNSATVAGNFGTVFAVDPNVQTSSTNEYTIGLQRELPALKSAFEIRYVGSYSKNLLRGIDINQVRIRDNGFLEDFNRARANLALTGNAFCTTAGCQPLTVFGNNINAPIRIGVAGGVSLNTFNNNLNAGTPGQLANNVLTTNADFNPNTNTQFPLLPNPNTGAVDLLFNGARYNYNSLQAEFRRRFTDGWAFQANYTFSKNLTDAVGTAQALFDPRLDEANPALEYSRADFDQTHTFNFNTIYELPFGRGKWFLNQGGVVDRIFGGYQLSTILRYGTGRPITFVDPRGTLNRAARSTRQTPNTSLSKDELKNLFGDFTRDGVRYYINPDVLLITRNPNGSTTSLATRGFGQPAFDGQVFFNVGPGQTGNLERAVVNGPSNFNMDVGINKKIRFSETTFLELRAEAFNVTNRNNFLLPLLIDVNSTTFGQLTPSLSTQSQALESPRRMQFAVRFEF